MRIIQNMAKMALCAAWLASSPVAWGAFGDTKTISIKDPVPIGWVVIGTLRTAGSEGLSLDKERLVIMDTNEVPAGAHFVPRDESGLNVQNNLKEGKPDCSETKAENQVAGDTFVPTNSAMQPSSWEGERQDPATFFGLEPPPLWMPTPPAKKERQYSPQITYPGEQWEDDVDDFSC